MFLSLFVENDKHKPTKEEVEKAKKEMKKMKLDMGLGRDVEEKSP